MLPPNLARDKNVCMMCEAFDKELRRIIADIPGIAVVPSLVLKTITDNLLLDLLAWQFHCDFYSPDLPLETKQELVLKSLDWHTRKGTPSVVEEIVSTVFSKATIQEWFEYGGLPYRFRVATEENMPDVEAVEKLMRAINSVKNTRSLLDQLTYLADLIDRVITKDTVNLTICPELEDRFNPLLEYNGAICYDGETINDTIFVESEYDGESGYDGQLEYDGAREVPRNGVITTDFTYSSKTFDATDITIRLNDIEEALPVEDLVAMSIRLGGFADTAAAEDSAGIAIRLNDEEVLPVGDCAAMALKINTADTVKAADSFTIGIRYEHEFDGSYDYDGTRDYDSMELQSLGG
jgi:phage tail P2-like protein